MPRTLLLTVTALVLTVLLLEAATGANPEKPKGVIIDRCLVTLIEQVAVPAKEAGQLEKLMVQEGTLIQIGQEVGQLDSEKAELEKKQAIFEFQVAEKNASNDVNVRFAEASWRVAVSHLKRGEEANERVPDSVTKTEMAERRLNVEKAKLQIEQAERDLEVARVTAQAKAGLVDIAESNLRRRKIVASTAGIVVERHKLAGEWLNPGDPVVRVMRVDRLRVEGFLDADLHGRELTGRAVVVEALLPGGKREKFAGKIVFVSPEIEPVTNHFRVWAEVENPQLHLRPGAKASMVIAEEAAK